MFAKILGKNKPEELIGDKEHQILIDKISNMNLTDMRVYINNKMLDCEVSEDGIIEIMKKLIMTNKNVSKRYIEIDDMQSKIKKGFDLVLSICTNKKITVVAIELIQEFMEVYKDIIAKYDVENKQIYGKKLKDALQKAIDNINARTELKRKMSLVGE
ncbi:hypothetical protein KKG72_04035 [bacterium]|nr:hypothetical protein [bacterium]MBU1994512.1 hypothetical protein [bacterium]